MLALKRLDAATIEAMARGLERAPLSYSHPGSTNASQGQGYTVDHNRIFLGRGKRCFEVACEAVRRWTMFDLGWVQQERNLAQVPIEVGRIAVVRSHTLGIWTYNFSRIVYTVDEPPSGQTAVARYGFAYGTLPIHVAAGEERFLVEWHRQEADDQAGDVFYDVLAHSRPSHWLARIGYPVTRFCQRRFGRHTLKRMKAEVAASAAT